MTTKNKILGIIFFAYLLLPVSATAQFDNEKEYRAYLFALIELLQKQVLLLQENPSHQNQNSRLLANNDSPDFDSFLIENTSEIKAWYQLPEPGSVSSVDNVVHRLYFSRFFDLIPNEYDDYFVDLLVFEDRGQAFDGFVETVPPYREDTWRLGVNESIFEFTTTSDLVEELFVHEFAHVISYEGVEGTIEPRNTTCHEYFSELGCPPANSYLIDFMNEFWDESDLDELVRAETTSIWTKQELQNNFVSAYAATSPAEDFADSFTIFVLEGRSAGDKLLDDKVNYFFQHEKLIELREEILTQL